MKTMTLVLGPDLAATGLAAQADEAMSDLEIAQTAYTAGGLDIRYAHLALAISENEAVRDFTQTMIRDHTAVNEAAGALIAELNVTPQDNALSQARDEGAAAKHAELMALLEGALVTFRAHEQHAEHMVAGLTDLARREFGRRLGAALSLAELPGLVRAHDGTHEVEVSIASFAFDPASVEVLVGDNITWTNADLAPHTATAEDGAWDTGTLERKAAALHARFRVMEGQLGPGPWFAGVLFSLVDAVFAPAFRYFNTFGRIGDFGVFNGLPGMTEWRRALADRRSVWDAIAPDYRGRLADFLRRKGSALSSMMEHSRIALRPA